MDENRDKKYGITTSLVNYATTSERFYDKIPRHLRKCDTTWKLSPFHDVRKDMEYDETLLNIIEYDNAWWNTMRHDIYDDGI